MGAMLWTCPEQRVGFCLDQTLKGPQVRQRNVKYGLLRLQSFNFCIAEGVVEQWHVNCVHIVGPCPPLHRLLSAATCYF